MANKKVVHGPPGSYLVDLSHKTLGKFDEKGKFETTDPDTIKRLEIMEEEQKKLEKESLGERRAREAREAKYKQYKEIAEVMVDVLEERGFLKGGKK